MLAKVDALKRHHSPKGALFCFVEYSLIDHGDPCSKRIIDIIKELVLVARVKLYAWNKGKVKRKGSSWVCGGNSFSP